jgi:tRNA threonylcarbamoyladenosine biosynthesis protein TsaE
VSAQTPSPPSWASSSPEETGRIAAALARELRPGDLVELEGELGAGKTTFVRAAARALGVTGPVASPTYTIGARYVGAASAVSHLDLYRSAGLTLEELVDLEPYLEDAVIFVEWPAAGRGVLPPARARVELRHQGADARLISLYSDDSALVEAVARSLS